MASFRNSFLLAGSPGKFREGGGVTGKGAREIKKQGIGVEGKVVGDDKKGNNT